MKNKTVTFTEEEEAYLRVIGEYDAIQNALALAETIDLLPDDPKKLLDRIDKEIPDDFESGVKKLIKISKKDPKFFKQIIALTEVLHEVQEGEDATSTKVEKVDLSTIHQEKDEEVKEKGEEIFEIIMTKIRSMRK